MIRTSPLTVAQLKTLYGVTRPMVRSVLYNRFAIPADYNCCLYYYRLKQWTGKEFRDYLTADGQLKSGDPAIPDLFDINYHFCTPSMIKADSIVQVSFRLAEDSFNIEPVALVKLVKFPEQLAIVPCVTTVTNSTQTLENIS